jgi:hypothetical protein
LLPRAPDYPGSKKYGHEKKLKIQHFCALELLKTLGRFFAKSIFSHDLCDISRDGGAPACAGSKNNSASGRMETFAGSRNFAATARFPFGEE